MSECDSEYDKTTLRRERPRHIREIDTHGNCLRFNQIEEYVEKYLREYKQYTGKIRVINFNPTDAMNIFGVRDIDGADMDNFFGIDLFSKNKINSFIDNLLRDFDGKFPPVGLVFVTPEMFIDRLGKQDICLKSLTEDESNFNDPRLFRRASFAQSEKVRCCVILLPLVCNPVYKGRNAQCQLEMAQSRGQEILTAVEISYCFAALKELLGDFHLFIPEFLRTVSKMEMALNGGKIGKENVLVGCNCSRWNHSHGNRPGIRFSTSGEEPAMHIGAAAALVRVFTEEDIVGSI